MYCMQNQAESPASVLAVWGGCTVLGGDKGRKINGTRIMPAKYFFQTKNRRHTPARATPVLNVSVSADFEP